MRLAAVALGLLIWLLAASSVMSTLVAPRGGSAIVNAKNRAMRTAFRAVARRTGSYERRDAVLFWFAPVGIVSSLIMWLVMFFLSYGLAMYGSADLSLGSSLREAGSSLFTLGYATDERSALTALDFVAAATGPIVIGLLVGYLPTMYAAYQRREAQPTLLLARAGEPNWAPELIRWHAINGGAEGLSELWPVWEQWAAEIEESHTNFPTLVHMRSLRPRRNWLISLLCVMDAAALHMSLNPHLPQGSMRLTIRQGIVCLQELCLVERIARPATDAPCTVSFEEFARAAALLADAGYTWQRDLPEAYAAFAASRTRYEAMAHRMAAQIDAVPAPWSGPRTPPLPVITPAPLPE